MRRLVSPLLVLAVTVLAAVVAAQTDPAPQGITSNAEESAPNRESLLSIWARSPEAQRNRAQDTQLSPELSNELLTVLARGVKPCDCYTRRVRWAWAIPTPKDPEHPAIVVAFSDPPKQRQPVLAYIRLAYVRFSEGRYVVTSSLTLKRPALEAKAALDVRLKPRRDVDDDGQLDVIVQFAEQWPGERYCGRATFASSAEQLSIDEETCDSEPTVSLEYP
jgi:hypothetical protein